MKSNTHFHFKKFTVEHASSTHKVGTDGVLIGAWTNVDNAKHILEVGAGSGVISLMLAQRTPADAEIDAVEIEQGETQQARLNVQKSPWPLKITIHHTAVQSFFPVQRYDVIISNPPYFVNSYKPPEEKRTRVRHTEDLSFEALIQSALRLLKPAGRLSVILPFHEGMAFSALARQHGLFVIRQCAFRSRAHKPIERLLMELGFSATTETQEELILYAEADNWSGSYRELMRDFYLKA